MTTIEQSQPLISIITAVYNGANSLESTIKSIVPQLTAEVEYVVIDGGSVDGTVDIIRRYSDFITFWVSEPDKGIYDAWNKGISNSRGKFIAFIGADDIMTENYVASYVKTIKTNPAVDYWSSKVVLAGSRPRIIGRKWAWERFMRYMTVAHVGSLHSRKLYQKHGLYDTSYRIVGDYEFLLRVGKDLRAGFIDEITVTMGAEGVSNKNLRQALLETRRAKFHSAACSRFVADADFFVAMAKGWLRNSLK